MKSDPLSVQSSVCKYCLIQSLSMASKMSNKLFYTGYQGDQTVLITCRSIISVKMLQLHTGPPCTMSFS